MNWSLNKKVSTRSNVTVTIVRMKQRNRLKQYGEIRSIFFSSSRMMASLWVRKKYYLWCQLYWSLHWLLKVPFNICTSGCHWPLYHLVMCIGRLVIGTIGLRGERGEAAFSRTKQRKQTFYLSYSLWYFLQDSLH